MDNDLYKKWSAISEKSNDILELEKKTLYSPVLVLNYDNKELPYIGQFNYCQNEKNSDYHSFTIDFYEKSKADNVKNQHEFINTKLLTKRAVEGRDYLSSFSYLNETIHLKTSYGYYSYLIETDLLDFLIKTSKTCKDNEVIKFEIRIGMLEGDRVISADIPLVNLKNALKEAIVKDK